jgi:hypothetical protein
MKELAKQQRLRDKAMQEARERFMNDKKKDKKDIEFTFDYEGSFYDVNPGKIQGEAVRTMK